MNELRGWEHDFVEKLRADPAGKDLAKTVVRILYSSEAIRDHFIAVLSRLIHSHDEQKPADGFEPARWWRVIYGAGDKLWCETSNEAAARKRLATCPEPGVLQRLFTRGDKSEWRWHDKA